MVSDSLDAADAIVVLGGRVDVGPIAAADLHKRGIAPRVAVGVSDFDQGQNGRLNRAALLEKGVPSSAIVDFNFRPHSTYGEARGFLDWAKTSGARSVVVPIDFFPSCRVRWIFNHELAPAGIRVIVQSVTPPCYSVNDWWQHRAGWRSFGSELIKFAYYRLKY
jgi:hypothetical protein